MTFSFRISLPSALSGVDNVCKETIALYYFVEFAVMFVQEA